MLSGSVATRSDLPDFLIDEKVKPNILRKDPVQYYCVRQSLGTPLCNSLREKKSSAGVDTKEQPGE